MINYWLIKTDPETYSWAEGGKACVTARNGRDAAVWVEGAKTDEMETEIAALALAMTESGITAGDKRGYKARADEARDAEPSFGDASDQDRM